MRAVLDQQHQFGKAIQPDHDRYQRDAFGEIGDAKREARFAGHRFLADGAQHQADRHRQQRGRQRAARNPRHHHETAGGERKEFRRPEQDRDLGKIGGEHHNADHGEGAADERADRDDGQRRAGAALFGELVAVDRGDDGSGLAGDVEQDRGGRAAIHRAVEDAGHHDQARGRVERESQRQDQRDAGDRAEARQHADRGACECANEGRQQIRRCSGDAQSIQQALEGVHFMSVLEQPLPEHAAGHLHFQKPDKEPFEAHGDGDRIDREPHRRAGRIIR